MRPGCLLLPAAAALLPAAAAAASRMLIASPGRLIIASLPSSGLGKCRVLLRQPLAGDVSWVAFREPDTAFAADEAGAAVVMLRVDAAAGSAGPPRTYASSAGLVHVALSLDGRRLLGAAAGAGAVDVWAVAPSGRLRRLKTVAAEAAPGPRKPRQDAPHPRQVVPDPTGRFFAVPDLGTDRIHLLDGVGDAFAVVNQVRVAPPGCGPRHGAFYPPPEPGRRATHFLVVCELANLLHVYALDYDAAGPRGIDFRPVYNVSTFGPGADPPASAAAGGLVVGPAGRDVYVSNRLTGEPSDHIAHFRVHRFGRRNGALALEHVGDEPCVGKDPRMFSLTTDGRRLLIANQQGPFGIWAMRRKRRTGALVAETLWNMPSSEFGESRPKFVQQIQ